MAPVRWVAAHDTAADTATRPPHPHDQAAPNASTHGSALALALGLALGVAASVLVNLGMILMKLSIERENSQVLRRAAALALGSHGGRAAIPPNNAAVSSLRKHHSEDSNLLLQAGRAAKLPRSSPAARLRPRSVSFGSPPALASRPPPLPTRPVVLQPIYMTGFGVFLTGQVMSIVSLAYLPQIVWTICGQFSLVSNAALSTMLLRERFTLWDALYTFLIIVSSAAVVVSMTLPTSHIPQPEAGGPAAAASSDPGPAAAHPNPPKATKEPKEHYSVAELRAMFLEPQFVAYVACLAALLAAALVGKARHIVSPAFAWGVFAATTGSMSVLLGKCTTEVVRLALANPDSVEFQAVSTYAITVCFVLAALLSLHGMNMALASGEALLVVPLLSVVNTILVIVGGAIYFDELARMLEHPLRIAVFVVGVLCALWSGTMLQRRHPEDPHEEALEQWAQVAAASPRRRSARNDSAASDATAGDLEAEDEEEVHQVDADTVLLPATGHGDGGRAGSAAKYGAL